MSFVEHYVHRKLMHRKTRWFAGSYYRHVVLHHRTYYHIFNYEPDEFGRTVNIKFEIFPSLPIVSVLAMVLIGLSVSCATMMLAAVLVHHLIWNLIHEEMHNPRGRFFSSWRIYLFLTDYHWMHHAYPGKNYNVVFPLADFVWGTRLKPSPRDRYRIKNQVMLNYSEDP